MDTAIKLNFINNSNDRNNSQIVIFSRNAATDLGELSVAWKVIQYCGQGDNHPFTYPMENSVGASDSYGNYTPQLSAQNGQLFSMSLTPSGNILSYTGQGNNPDEIHILNGLARGAINANIYKGGKLFACKTSLAPQQKAAFQFKPTIWIGVVSQIEEGSVMDSAIMSSINTEISLIGLASADIVMTGGGVGSNATPFAFNLENIKLA